MKGLNNPDLDAAVGKTWRSSCVTSWSWCRGVERVR
nr:Uncharacterised protein [Klebsiella pneumoniae]